MFKDKFKNIKALMKAKTKDSTDKKKIENLVMFLVLLIITVVAINTILGDNKNSNKLNNEQNSAYKQLANESINNSSTIFKNTEYNLEEQIENIISKIYGVGQVKVLITYSETSEVVPLYNETYTESTTEETDTNGGVRTIKTSDNSKEIIYKEQSGEKIPVTKKTLLPKIEGAVIIAEGAKNTTIKVNIIQAVEALTGLATHKIQVFEMN